MNSDYLHTGPTSVCMLLRATKRYSNRPAFAWEGGVITYRDIEVFMGRAQVALRQEYLYPGDTIATLSRNGAEDWVLGCAAHGMGLSVIALHPMGSLQDHLSQIAAAEVRCVIVDARGFAQRGEELAAAGLKMRILGLGESSFADNFLERINSIPETPPIDVSEPFGIAGRHFTGGTTGVPKQILIRHNRFSAGMNAFIANVELPAVPRVIAVGPVSHVTGILIMPTLLRGGSIYMLPRFDLQLMLETIQAQQINTALMVPTMIYMMLDSPAMETADLSSLELILYSASPMSPQRLKEAVERVGPVFAQLYAQSECGAIAYRPKADHDLSRPETFSACGFPVPECELRLLDANGQVVEPGEAGEICVRAAHVFEGYFRNDEATTEVLRDNWLHTGDIARADGEGRLYIVDRKKDMIVTGGFNVYSREVEDVIAAHPAVAMCAVIGVPDDRWGEAVHAYIITRAGSSMTTDEIIALVKERRGSVCAPKAIHIVSQLPLTANGKIDKKSLRAAVWDNTNRQVN